MSQPPDPAASSPATQPPAGDPPQQPFNVRTFCSETAGLLQVAPGQVEGAVKLFDDGNTIPFIARYRKEQTSGLDERQLRHIEDALEKRPAEIPFPRIGQHRHNRFTFEFRKSRQPQSHGNRRTTTDPCKNSFFSTCSSSVFNSFFVWCIKYFIINTFIKNFWNEVWSNSLQRVPCWISTT